MGILSVRLNRPPPAPRRGRALQAAVLLWLAGACASPALGAPAAGCHTVALHIAGTEDRVVGAEDIVVDQAEGVAYIAAYDRRAVARERRDGKITTTGGLYALDLTVDMSTGVAAVRDMTRGFQAQRDFRPHGIDLHREDTARATLYAVNRAFTDRGDGPEPDTSIEVFDLTAGRLSHRGDAAGTLRDPLLCSPNDIAATGPESFFVTNDHGACAGAGRMAEDVIGLDRSYVLHFDGTSFQRVADGIAFANGIAIGPASEAAAATLYVAATRDRSIQIYDLAAPIGRSGATLRTRIPLDAAPDNLTWGPDGTLYVGAHPDLFAYAFYRNRWFGRSMAPSLALRVDPDVGSVFHAYADDGRQLSGATVAVPFGDLLLVGSAFDDHLVVCGLGGDR